MYKTNAKKCSSRWPYSSVYIYITMHGSENVKPQAQGYLTNLTAAHNELRICPSLAV